MSDFSQVVSAPTGRFDGIARPYSVDEVLRLRGSFPVEHSAGAARRAAPVGAAARRGAGPRARRGHRQPGDADGPRRPAGDLSLRLAGGGRRQHRRRDVSRTSRSTRPIPGPSWRGGSTARSPAPTRSSIWKAGAKRDWFAPILADAEAGFGGPLNCFEIMKAYIEAGVAGVHFEDQLASREEVRPSWAARC